jgi:hypothetical protein
MARAIRAAGYNCPDVTNFRLIGEDHYGEVAEVRCGHIAFRYTQRPSGLPKIEPWR